MVHSTPRIRVVQWLVLVVACVALITTTVTSVHGLNPRLRSVSTNALQPLEVDRSLLASESQSTVDTSASAGVGIVTTKFVTGAYGRTNAGTRNLEQLRRPILEFTLAWNANVIAKDVLGRQWTEDYYLQKMNALTVVNKQQDLAHSNNAFNSKFTYYLDVKGRPTAALGYVSRSAESDPSGAAADYCDVLKLAYPGEYNRHAGVGTGVWTKGHIMAATLGGHNTNPLNFFPQRAFDNNGGRYAQGEQVAIQYLNDLKPTHLAVKDCVHVQVLFEYPDANQIIPSHGTYSVTVKKACLNSAWTFTNTIVAGPDHAMWVTDWSQDETPATILGGGLHAKKATPTRN